MLAVSASWQTRNDHLITPLRLARGARRPIHEYVPTQKLPVLEGVVE